MSRGKVVKLLKLVQVQISAPEDIPLSSQNPPGSAEPPDFLVCAPVLGHQSTWKPKLPLL